MKLIKKTVSIISIVVSGFILFQSCASGMFNIIKNNGGYSGTMGVLLVMFMIVGGILCMTSHDYKSTIVSGVFYFLGGLFTLLSDTGIFKDLVIWGWMSFIFGVIIILIGAYEA